MKRYLYFFTLSLLPGNAAIIVRRVLDDARLFAPYAFMVLFPNRYRFGDMTYEWQIKKQIEWKKFRWALNEHFKSLCQIDCDFFLCTQNYSCFRDCKIENLIEDYNDTELVPPIPHLPVLQRSQSPNISRFEPKYLGEWNIVQDRFMHIGTDCFTLFFAPNFYAGFCLGVQRAQESNPGR